MSDEIMNNTSPEEEKKYSPLRYAWGAFLAFFGISSVTHTASKKRKKLVGDIVCYIVLLIGAFTMVYPFWWMIAASFADTLTFVCQERPEPPCLVAQPQYGERRLCRRFVPQLCRALQRGVPRPFDGSSRSGRSFSTTSCTPSYPLWSASSPRHPRHSRSQRSNGSAETSSSSSCLRRSWSPAPPSPRRSTPCIR